MAGPLANRRQENFCLLFVQGKTQADAFNGAGYKKTGKRTAEVCARRLLRNVAVQRRIAEMQRQASESVEVTVASLMQEAAQIQRSAMQAGNQSAAVAALTAKAKIAGLWVEKSETENLNLNYAISDQLPTEAQWEAERTEHRISNQMGDDAGKPIN